MSNTLDAALVNLWKPGKTYQIESNENPCQTPQGQTLLIFGSLEKYFKMNTFQTPQARTLLIFGTLDKYLTVKSAEDSANFVKDFRLELLEGVRLCYSQS